KFDLKTHSLRSVANLILSAYSKGGNNIPYDEKSRRLVQDLIEAGNNFLGHENIYLCVSKDEIAGLVIGYCGKSGSKIKVLLDLFIKLRLTQMLNYLIVGSQLFHSGYTPYLEEDDFYISVLVVDEKYRSQGIGTFLLKEGILIAREKNCKNVVLDVDNDNEIAKSLYKKFGFITRKDQQLQSSTVSEEICTMEYRVI
ncbi:MAG: GNAT family N-acetyltransferase, partial [Deltaproteobacteria bacterium]|nr:GNAT family N-acetyltransferase [Deltaproteobacteria bacterium]